VVNIRSVEGRDLPDGWSLLKWIHNEIRSTQPWKITIAEDLQNNEWITKSTDEGGAGFSSQWDAGFVHPIRDATIAQNDAGRNLDAVRDAL
jgi:1,4-alpha-glucan branching enzyme